MSTTKTDRDKAQPAVPAWVDSPAARDGLRLLDIRELERDLETALLEGAPTGDVALHARGGISHVAIVAGDRPIFVIGDQSNTAALIREMARADAARPASAFAAAYEPAEPFDPCAELVRSLALDAALAPTEANRAARRRAKRNSWSKNR